MRWEPIGRIALIGAAASAAAFAAVSIWLTTSYRPSEAQAWDDVVGGSDRSTSAGWQTAQSLLAAPLLLLTIGAVVITVVTVALRRKSLALAMACVGAAIAIAGIAAAVFTIGAVRWDQLALFSVTVGTNADGYWAAAFGDDVRFVLIGGTEVSQETYRSVLLAHLAGPFITMAGLATMFVALGRPDTPAQRTGSFGGTTPPLEPIGADDQAPQTSASSTPP